MEALAERLSQLDAEAEGAIRVVMFYDTLMRRRVDLPALARASAGLAECVAGDPAARHGPGDPHRRRTAARRPTPSAAPFVHRTDHPRRRGDRHGVAGTPRPARLPLDEVLLDRLAIAAAAVVERYGPARTTMADPALVELVISADSDEAARARALRLLGFAADLPVRVVAVRSALPLDQVGGLVCPARPVKAAPLADVGVILATTVDPARFPAGRARGHRRRRRPRPLLARGPHRAALHHRTPAGRPLRRPGRAGAARAGTAGGRPRQRRRGRDRPPRRRPGRAGDAGRLLRHRFLRQAADCCTCTTAASPAGSTQIGKTLGIDLTDPTGLTRARLALTAWRLLDA